MVKYELRKQGYSITEHYQNHMIVGIMLLVLTFLLIASMLFTTSIFKEILGSNQINISPENMNVFAYLFYLITNGLGYWGFLIIMCLFYFLYLGIKLLMTVSASNNKADSTKLKILEMKGMPICYSKEAFTVKETVVIYIVPILFMYSLNFVLSVITFDPFILTMSYFMCFLFAFDLTVVLYTLFFKIIYKMDYIAVDFHVYQVTLYKRTHAKFYAAIQPNIKKAEKKFTCVNEQCENYGQELKKENSNFCPVCGGKKYPYDVFDQITTCFNENCKNYKQELHRETKICASCGEETGELIFKFKTKLKIPAVIISISIFIVFNLFYLLMNFNGFSGHPLVLWVGILQLIAYAVNCIIGIYSRSKIAISIIVIMLLANAAILYLFEMI